VVLRSVNAGLSLAECIAATCDFNLTRLNEVDYSLSLIDQKCVQVVSSQGERFRVLRYRWSWCKTIVSSPCLMMDDWSAFSTAVIGFGVNIGFTPNTELPGRRTHSLNVLGASER
jgi:hypothetical protein